MTEKTTATTTNTKSRSRSRSRLYSDGDIILDSDNQRRHSTVSGKEVIIRTSYRLNSYDAHQSRTALLSSRRSLRRQSKESNKLKHSKLEPLDAYEYNSYTLHKSKNRNLDGGGGGGGGGGEGGGGGGSGNNNNHVNSRSKSSSGGVTMREIFSSLKLGMSTFSVPRFYAKNSSKSSKLLKEEYDDDDDDDHRRRRRRPSRNQNDNQSFRDKSNRNLLNLSASSTDIRSPSSIINTSVGGQTPRSIRSGSGTNDETSSISSSGHGGSNGSDHTRNNIPGITGIRNHGNTCYMNAILQCLCHTDNLAKYFVLDHYKTDLSRRNKNNSRKYGTRGEVTEQLAVVFKSLWSSQYKPEISNQFKLVVGKYETQYQGSNQQDAQEFLLWLLDKVHEDLNTATKKKYKKIGVSNIFSFFFFYKILFYFSVKKTTTEYLED